MRLFNKNFWISLLWCQNEWHKHSVLVHTLKVAYGTFKYNQPKMFPAALLHDIGKPFSVHEDDDDLALDFISFSFTNHEEFSYQLIKNWSFISDYTKNLVRYHYIIRDMDKSLKKGKLNRYNRLKRKWDKLDDAFKEDIKTFMMIDDYGKK